MKPFIFDSNTYQDEDSQRLLKENAEFDAENTVDPVDIFEDYGEVEIALNTGMPFGIFGEAGTCKTSSIIKYGVKHGIPVCVIPCSNSTPENILLGKMTFINGNSVDFVEGLLTLGQIRGWITVLDEINNLMPANQTLIQDVFTKKNTFICLTNRNKVYTKHPNARLAATGNPGYIGAGVLSEALRSRLTYQIYVKYVDAKGIEHEGLPYEGYLKIGKSYWPWLPDDFFRATYDLSQAIKDYAAKHVKPKVSCGVRELIGTVLALIEHGSKVSDEAFNRVIRTTYWPIFENIQLRSEARRQFIDEKDTKNMLGIILKAYNNVSKPSHLFGPSNQPISTFAQPSSGSQLADAITGKPQGSNRAR